MFRNATPSASPPEYPVLAWWADVDWITQVYEDADEAERATWRAELWQEERHAAGDRVRSWSLAGFAGRQCGGIAYGRRGTSAVVQVTSQRAGEAFGVLTALGGRPSRLDLALTAETLPGQFDPPSEAYTAILGQNGRGRRTDARTLIQSTGGGATCYVGSGSSEQRLRVYDKGVEEESAPPGTRWRWEVQARRVRARAHATMLAAAPHRESAVASHVLGHLRHLGLRAPGCNSPCSHPCGVHTTPDAANTLRWLETGVAPAVERILRIYPRETILRALGLAAPAASGTTPL